MTDAERITELEAELAKVTQERDTEIKRARAAERKAEDAIAALSNAWFLIDKAIAEIEGT